MNGEGGFDPARHLAFDRPARRYTLSELGIDPKEACADFAATSPFRLLSPEGVRRVRQELSSEPVQRSCRFSAERTPSVLRGAIRYSPFLRALWRSPATSEIISSVADLPLIPHPMDYEIAHVNMQAADPERNVDDWHKDSFPFACVVMLTDCERMEGGETLVEDAHGKRFQLRFPAAGYAVLMHGQHVRHCATRAKNSPERTTMVTHYIARDVRIEDRSTLKISKMYSDVDVLLREWSAYRFDRLREMTLRWAEDSEASFDRETTVERCGAMIRFLERTREDLLALPTERDRARNWRGYAE